MAVGGLQPCGKLVSSPLLGLAGNPLQVQLLPPVGKLLQCTCAHPLLHKYSVKHSCASITYLRACSSIQAQRDTVVLGARAASAGLSKPRLVQASIQF